MFSLTEGGLLNGYSLSKRVPSPQTLQRPSWRSSLSCVVLQAKKLSLSPKALFLLGTGHLLIYRKVIGDRALQCHTCL